MAGRMILPISLGNLWERFIYEESQFKIFHPSVKIIFPPAENINLK